MNDLKDVPLQQRPNIDYGSGRYDPVKSKRYTQTVDRGTFNQQLTNVGDSSTTVLNSNSRRNYLIVQNNGATDVFINFGNKANIGNLKIIPGGNYEPIVIPTNSIHLVSGLGFDNNCAIVEGFENA